MVRVAAGISTTAARRNLRANARASLCRRLGVVVSPTRLSGWGRRRPKLLRGSASAFCRQGGDTSGSVMALRRRRGQQVLPRLWLVVAAQIGLCVLLAVRAGVAAGGRVVVGDRQRRWRTGRRAATRYGGAHGGGGARGQLRNALTGERCVRVAFPVVA